MTKMNIFKKLFSSSAKRKNRSEWKIRIQRDTRNTDKLLNFYLDNNSNCVDIGAHKGLFLRKFLTLAPKGSHIAFEPLPKLARDLSLNFPKVKVHNYAVSNKSGNAIFYTVPGLKSWSGLEKQPYPKKVEPIEIKVDLVTLDDIIPDNHKIRFIKIDVEGAELEVLQGGKETIKRCKPIIYFEHAKIHNINYDTDSEKVFEFLTNECGLEICDLELKQIFTRKEFNEIYHSSYDSNYDRHAQTNFIARPPTREA